MEDQGDKRKEISLKVSNSIQPAAKKLKGQHSGYVQRRKLVSINYVTTIGHARALDHMQRWLKEFEYDPGGTKSGDTPPPGRNDKWFPDIDTG